MKFFNVVNEQQESIGDLWLGIDRDGKEEATEMEGPLNVEITLRIDENNLIEVTAVLKEFPEVQLSKTLSRGKADEKLFMSLEETIAEANRKQYKEYTILDLLYRSLSAIKDINRVVNPETGEVDEALYERASLKVEKARKMAARGHGSKPTIYYAKSVLSAFGPAIPQKKQTLIRKGIKRLEEMDEHGTYEENVRALKHLDDALGDLGAVNGLMEIRKAGAICMKTDPAKAPKFFRYITDILEAFREKDPGRASVLLEEIWPETRTIVEKCEAKTSVIYKDITK
jgi:molecular chaperone DnaK